MDWKALLKVIGVAAGAVGVEQGSQAAAASGYQIVAQILIVLGMVGAYLLKSPIAAKNPDLKL